MPVSVNSLTPVRAIQLSGGNKRNARGQIPMQTMYNFAQETLRRSIGMKTICIKAEEIPATASAYPICETCEESIFVTGLG